MQKNLTDALIVHCIDFRLQAHLNRWLDENLGKGNFDRVSLAGGVFDFETVLRQVEIAERLHEIKKVVFVNHEDCGAYGEAGNRERHAKDLRAAREELAELYPSLSVALFYLKLNGDFERVS